MRRIQLYKFPARWYSIYLNIRKSVRYWRSTATGFSIRRRYGLSRVESNLAKRLRYIGILRFYNEELYIDGGFY